MMATGGRVVPVPVLLVLELVPVPVLDVDPPPPEDPLVVVEEEELVAVVLLLLLVSPLLVALDDVDPPVPPSRWPKSRSRPQPAVRAAPESAAAKARPCRILLSRIRESRLLHKSALTA
jgi:hypothetical protein